jgi:hypothetical protein
VVGDQQQRRACRGQHGGGGTRLEIARRALGRRRARGVISLVEPGAQEHHQRQQQRREQREQQHGRDEAVWVAGHTRAQLGQRAQAREAACQRTATQGVEACVDGQRAGGLGGREDPQLAGLRALVIVLKHVAQVTARALCDCMELAVTAFVTGQQRVLTVGVEGHEQRLRHEPQGQGRGQGAGGVASPRGAQREVHQPRGK